MFWIIVLIIIVVVIAGAAASSASKKKTLATLPKELSDLMKEEFPEFESDFKTTRFAAVIEKGLSEGSKYAKHYKSDGTLKNEKSRVAMRDYFVDELAPLISNSFADAARNSPDDFHLRFETVSLQAFKQAEAKSS